jgi:two-component system sensor histidine kinase QseC
VSRLGYGLGHRVVDKIAALHGATLSELPGEAHHRCYRLSFAGSVTAPASDAPAG